MLIPITEQVFVPIHRIERISFFGTTASVKYVDQREVERIEGHDAQRMMMWVNARVHPQKEETPAKTAEKRSSR